MGIAVAVFIAGFSYFYLNKGEAIPTEAAPVKKVPEKEETKAEAAIEASFKQKAAEKELPAYEKMSEDDLVQEVHKMTHQKVAAGEKWGASEITQDKVNALYEAIQKKNFADMGLQTDLLKILKPWKKGDFRNAVEAHNEVWDYQNGNIGKATRLLTPVEEEKYIEKNFK
jgi:hypothetical protein